MEPDAILKSIRPSVFSLPIYRAGHAPKSFDGVQIKLSSNENRFGPSPKVLEAIRKTVSEDLFVYPDSSFQSLRKALTDYWKKRNIFLEKNSFVFGNGSGEVLDLIFSAFLREGDFLIVPEKSFSLYRLLSLSKGAKVREVERKENLKIDLNALVSGVRETGARLVVFSNPDNPTSTFLPLDEVRAFLSRIPEETLVVIDEAYIHFEGVCSSSLSLLKDYPNLVLTYTFSKAYALASMRVGYALMHEKLGEIVNRVRLPFNVGSLSQLVSVLALTDTDYFDPMLKSLLKERERVYRFFRDRDYHILKPHGNFVFIRLKEKQADLPYFLEERGVSIRNLASFGFDKTDIRITIGTKSDNDILLDLVEAYDKRETF